jgi:prevent-host-death family protein
MKVIPLSEATASLSKYGRLCHDEPVIVTVNGVPSFQLVPLEEGDDLIDRLLEYNPKFRRTLESRLGERSLSIKDVQRMLK